MAGKKRTIVKKWSQQVTEKSNALDLEEGVFTWKDPKKIARSLQHSAEQSTRRKSSPYRSAMSMLVFYINRAGKSLWVRGIKNGQAKRAHEPCVCRSGEENEGGGEEEG